MTAQSNFPTISNNLNFNGTTVKNGGQKASTAWVQEGYVDHEVPLTGEWYFEYITDNYVYAFMGIGRLQFSGSLQHNVDFSFVQAGEYRYNGVNQADTGSIGTGDIVGVYINDGIIKVYVNNSLDHTYTQNLSLVGQPVYPRVIGSSNTTINFGQDSSFLGVKTAQGNTDGNGIGDFYYTPPGNALALCSANAPTSSNIDPAETNSNYPTTQCSVATYTGNGSTQSINMGMQPDLLWFKNRGTANSWVVFDSSRGVTKTISTNANNGESTGGYTNLDAFTSTGFDLDGGGTGDVNQSSASLIAFGWRANGGTTASNSDGSITSTVQANQNAGFSIVQTSGNGGNATIGHGLGSVPKFILSKQLTGGNFSWVSYHPNQGASGSGGELGYMHLDSSQQFSDYNLIWNDTAPTSSVFSVGSAGNVNGNGSTYVHYCWSEIDGFSKFGYYVGNGNTNGPYIFTGMRPRIIILKRSDGTSGWTIIDTERYTHNDDDGPGRMELDQGAAEVTGSSATREMDLYGNGFKIKSTNSNINTDGARYIYACWGDVPYKYNNAR